MAEEYNNESSYQNSYQNNYQSGGTGGNDGWQHTNSSSGSGDGGKKKGSWKAVLAVILAAAVGVAGGYGVSRVTGGRQSSPEEGEEKAEASEPETQESAQEGEEEKADEDAAEDAQESSNDSLQTTKTTAVVTDVTEVVENVMPSVVSVYNNYTETSQDFFGQTYESEATSTGTGFIIAEDTDNNELLIATNNHVVEDADSLEILFIDESTAEANIKGTDASNDLAVIAVSLDDISDDTRDEIKVATLGDSDELKIGEPVVAIGNALGYGQSVTTGVVSALNREISSSSISGTFIQTDAAINPGNSGGPLVDLNGNVIGINSSKIGGTTVDGVGFAIPMSTAIPVIQDLMNQKTKTTVDEEDRGYLGISGVSVTSQVASAYGMPEGVYVAQIIEGGAAAESDLQKGDVITAIEGSTVDDMEALQKQLTYYAAGETVTLTVQRQDGSGEYSEMDVDVTLGDKSAINDYEDEQQAQQSGQSGRSFGYNNDKSTEQSGSADSKKDGSDQDKEGQQEGSSRKESGESSGKDDADKDSSENEEDNSSYYSFFNDIFGNN